VVHDASRLCAERGEPVCGGRMRRSPIDLVSQPHGDLEMLERPVAVHGGKGRVLVGGELVSNEGYRTQ
jgi:hypothetical protein